MSDLSGFEELRDEYYPGSKQKRSAPPPPAPAEDEEWDAHPIRKTVKIGGETRTLDFFLIGSLANALGFRPVTIRKWEREGVFPQARYRSKGGPAGQRRLYTRPQILGVLKIAQEEGMLVPRPTLEQKARFRDRVLELWERT